HRDPMRDHGGIGVRMQRGAPKLIAVRWFCSVRQVHWAVDKVPGSSSRRYRSHVSRYHKSTSRLGTGITRVWPNSRRYYLAHKGKVTRAIRQLAVPMNRLSRREMNHDLKSQFQQRGAVDPEVYMQPPRILLRKSRCQAATIEAKS